MRTLYLHVGPPKTGTSAIQHALRAHDDSVVIYPKVGLWADGAHHNLVFNFFEIYLWPQMVKRSRAELLDELSQSFGASERDVVISSEVLFGRAGLGHFVDALASLSSSPIAIEAIAVCREHFALAASQYNQQVKDPVTMERDTPDDYLRRAAAKIGYIPQLRALRQMGAAVTVMPYEPAGTLVARFLTHVGFPADRISAAATLNVSMSRKALVATLAANNVARDIAERNRFSEALRKMPQFAAPPGFIFGAEAARRADEHFCIERQVLALEFGVVLQPPCFHDWGLHLDYAELGEIRAVTAALGADGEAIVQFASRFLRE